MTRTLLIPEFLYGSVAEVRKRVRKRVRLYAKGIPWEEAFAGPLLDKANTPGIVVINMIEKSPRARPCFHVWLVVEEATHLMFPDDKGVVRLARAQASVIRDELCKTPWGTLALIGGRGGGTFKGPPSEQMPTIRAALRLWPDLCPTERWFGNSTSSYEYIGTCCFGLHYALYRRGIQNYTKTSDDDFDLPTLLQERGVLEQVQRGEDLPYTPPPYEWMYPAPSEPVGEEQVDRPVVRVDRGRAD